MPVAALLLRGGGRCVVRRAPPAAIRSRLSTAQRWEATDAARTALDASASSSRSLLLSVARDAAALQNLLETLASDAQAQAALVSAAQALAAAHARDAIVFATGIGKSAIVAQRLASTLASVSVRSRYVHGSEWMHGELGNLRRGDAVVILSHSGQTAELLPLPPLLQASGCSVLAVTGSADSALAQQSDVAVVAPAQDQTQCPVPSRSIVVQEAVVNALVEFLVEHADERVASFRRNHPGGAIGARLQQ